ncbi:pectin methylesterase, putative [Talaromyces stipitatus ATCC 10500]|uniref:Pectinesterase n=1 Tax=Talaromyces stipitatus (strain ATCC 10500 / CBS 375.48 / QM 6759 / NRRL 1006) TaxID=441959 RepID=B8MIG6_TALSN|nr:pectin methylesterase, putative [Talaromyces stipitatus ATCC 10500]EED14650.1 pectin methylesterase, putative [Talaromyces stipitatus ATCC 10500]
MKTFILTLALAVSALAGSRMTPPAGSIVVAKSGGKYSTISAAIAALSTTSTSTQTIFIEQGTYNEQVYIPSLKGELVIYGQTEDTSSYSSNLVTITHGLSASQAGSDDLSATLRNYAAKSRIYNINVKNTYGSGAQALALSAYATDQGYYGCQFIGYQDTVLAETGNQLYAKCYIEGAIDFIFGQHATAWFDGCDIGVVARNGNVGTITANGRSSSSDPSYYVINKSNIAAASGQSVSAGSYYLGRPWSQYARVVFQYTSMSNVINSAGWEVWSSSQPNTQDVLFGEYDNSGAGSQGTRASFAKKLSSPIGISSILGADYTSWVDTSYLS